MNAVCPNCHLTLEGVHWHEYGVLSCQDAMAALQHKVTRLLAPVASGQKLPFLVAQVILEEVRAAYGLSPLRRGYAQPCCVRGGVPAVEEDTV